jgi:hypothetical protein
MPAHLRWISGALLVLAGVACGKPGDRGAPGSGPAPAAPSAAFPPADAPFQETEGAVKASKGAIPFTISLPPGLTNVSKDKERPNYARSATDEQGPIVRVFASKPMPLDEVAGKIVKEKLTLLQKVPLDQGWLVAVQVDKDKVVLVNSQVTAGPVTLECWSFMKGDAVMAKPEAAVALLEKACRSLAFKK